VFWKIPGRRVLPKVLKGLPEEPVIRKASGTPLPETFWKKDSSG